MDEDDALKPSEAARDRRRDHDAEARARAGMQTGLAKQFKVVLDSQKRRAGEAERLLEDRAADGLTSDRRRAARGSGKSRKTA
jgi:hypothetical protein